MRARAGAAPSALAVALGLLLAPPGASAQAEAGTYRVELREEVEVCERGIRVGNDRRMGRGAGWDDAGRCSRGVARLEVRGDAAGVDAVELEPWSSGDAASARTLDPAEAADLLVAVARSPRSPSEAGETAVMVATLLRGVEVWPDVLALARDRGVDGGVREAAVFWLGQGAAEEATRGLADLAREPDEDDEVREAAVFALSQRPPDEGVPALLELARSSERGRVRRSALFWLAQSGDPRAVALFEEILLGPGGR